MDITLDHLSCPFSPWRPEDGRIFKAFSFDTETTDIDDDHPETTPTYVLGAACDGQRGVFISTDNLLPFFDAHRDVPVIMHHAAFDLKVIGARLKPTIDIYRKVEDNQVWDTLILNRLHSLATEGHTARGESSLADCARIHLDVTLNKDQKTAHGKAVRTTFGQFLGQPPAKIPTEYLVYLAHDTIATWHLFRTLMWRIEQILKSATSVFGYVNPAWLQYVTNRFGPLTHHTQLRASIVMDVLRSNGIGVDRVRREEKAAKVQALLEDCKERMRQHGFLIGMEGSERAMQSILSQLKREHPQVVLKKTPTGKWSTADEDLTELAAEYSFFADYRDYKLAEKLLSTYLKKMGQPRLHPRFGYLLETGRTFCGGGFNLQSLPREKSEKDVASTIRGCFVPNEGNVFIDCDYGQIELVVLGYVCGAQLGIPSRLATLINEGQDVHRLIAAAVMGKEPKDVTKAERDSAKPVSFGRPGGMGKDGLRRVAKNGYGIDLADDEVQKRIDAYHQLCPELDAFLKDEVDSGAVLADSLDLTSGQYRRAIGKNEHQSSSKDYRPAGFLGGMLLKVLRDKIPQTSTGAVRLYTQEEIDFFWEKAQQLPLEKPNLQAKLKARKADLELWEHVRNWAGRRSVFTVTGRLRAKATYCSSRNCVFQGAAADGAVLGLWLVWRAGYKLVDFVHDQLVVEAPADEKVKDRVAHIEALMKQGMLMVVPGMNVQVESVVTCSLNKKDLDPRYDPKTKELLHAQQPTDCAASALHLHDDRLRQ